jgi:hypothetical protein
VLNGIRYDGGRVAANEDFLNKIKWLGLRRMTRESGLDRKTIRQIAFGQKVKLSTLAKVIDARGRCVGDQGLCVENVMR